MFVCFKDSFCSLVHLVKIDLSKNRLTELPRDFGQLENLQHLDLLGNQLVSLPESFHRLQKLKWLDLKDNPLEPQLKKNAGDCLDEKQCRICAQRVSLEDCCRFILNIVLASMVKYSDQQSKLRFCNLLVANSASLKTSHIHNPDC